MKKHTKGCDAKEGVTYKFDNGNIISFEDNFKYMGNVPFTVYFDFAILISILLSDISILFEPES